MEKTLSEKINCKNDAYSWVDVEDLKQAIKELKKEFSDIEYFYQCDVISFKDWSEDRINKIFGKELSK